MFVRMKFKETKKRVNLPSEVGVTNYLLSTLPQCANRSILPTKSYQAERTVMCVTPMEIARYNSGP